jgi:hypothetical protein
MLISAADRWPEAVDVAAAAPRESLCQSGDHGCAIVAVNLT